MWKTVARFISEPIWQEIDYGNFWKRFYEATLENKDGEFVCYFSRKDLLSYSPKSVKKGRIVILECQKKFGFICRKIRFLDNEKELTSWQWEQTHTNEIKIEIDFFSGVWSRANAVYEEVKKRIARIRLEGKEITEAEEKAILEIHHPNKLYSIIKDNYFPEVNSIFSDGKEEDEDEWWWLDEWWRLDLIYDDDGEIKISIRKKRASNQWKSHRKRTWWWNYEN